MENKDYDPNEFLVPTKQAAQKPSACSRRNIPRPRSKTPELRRSTSACARVKTPEHNLEKKGEEEELERILELDRALKELVKDGDSTKLEKEIELL